MRERERERKRERDREREKEKQAKCGAMSKEQTLNFRPTTN
jgi:hypothetical protein